MYALDCEICLDGSQPGRREWLGCQAPSKAAQEVDLVDLLESRSLDVRSVFAKSSLEEHYPFADVGGVTTRLGFFWDRCPRSYIAFAPEEVRAVASSVFSYMRALDAGDPGAWRHSPLTPLGASLIEALRFLRSEVSADKRKREQEQEKAKRRARGG